MLRIHSFRLGAALLAALAVLAPVAARAQSGEVRAVQLTVLPKGPDDSAWKGVPSATVPLITQDMVEPRLLEPSTAGVQVRAASDGKNIAFRLQWADATDDDTQKVSRFSDACAVQLPATVTPDVPAPQMGETGKPVEITYWRAAWQAMVDGREDSIKVFEPGASVDHYPFEAPSLEKGSPDQLAMAKRYAPARALENPMAGPRTQPVQDLLAEGPGTLHPAAETRSTGAGMRVAQNGWAVMLVRPLPNGLRTGTRSQVAFAVWQGSQGEAGARKMRSAWLPIAVETNP